MSRLLAFFCCLMVLAPQMSFIDGIPMSIGESQPHLGEMCIDFIKFCACGTSDTQYVSVAIKMCSNVDPITKKFTCKPCNESLLQYDICEKYEHCVTCSSESCKTCSEDKTSKFCFENAENNALVPGVASKPSFPMRFRIPRGDPNNHRRILREKTGCDTPKVETAEVNCILYDHKVSCTEKCIWGYKLRDNAIARTAECTYRAKTWTPVSLEECYQYINCDVTLVSNGKLKCIDKHPTDPDVCQISCTTYDEEEGGDIPEAKYVCDNQGNFSPELPYCAKLTRTISGSSEY